MQEKNERPVPAIKKILLRVLAVLFALISVCSIAITGQTVIRAEGSPAEKLKTLPETAEGAVSEKIFLRNFSIEYGGLFARLAGIRSTEGYIKLDNGQLTGPSLPADTAPAAEGVADLNAFCRENGTPLLYVNAPAKPLTGKDLNEIGIDSFINDTEDRFVRELADAGVDCLDLRGPVEEHFGDPYACFYRTDHHWTAEAGLFAAGVILQEAQDRYGLTADTDRLDPALYKTTRYEDIFLGEMGKKTGAVFAGTEDLLVIEPLFPTHLTLQIPSRKLNRTGDFSILLDTENLKDPSIYDTGLYYTYLYGNDGLQKIRNEDAPGGRILVVKDSFAQVVDPYLAMGVRDLTIWDVRKNTTGLRDEIRDNDYDLVIVMYTGGMIKRAELMYRFE